MKKIEKINKNKLMVYLFFFIITFCKGIGLSNSSKIYIVSYAFGIVLVIQKIFIDKFKPKEILNLFIILFIGLMDYFIGGISVVLFTAIAFCCLKNIEINKIIKIMFWTRLFSFILIIILSLTGIIENNIITFYRATEGGYIKRYSFGYSHPNIAHSSFSLILILWGYLFYDKINISKITVLEILNLFLYKFTLSRTGFIIVTFYLIFIYIAKNFKTIKFVLPRMLKVCLVIFILITFIMALGYGEFKIFYKLDSILTGRIRYMSLLIDNYKFPIIGSNSYGKILFDNGYFSLIYEGGLLATVWFGIHTLKTNKKLSFERREKEIIMTIACLFYCIFESFYMSILMNPSLLFFTYYMFNEKKYSGGKNNE